MTIAITDVVLRDAHQSLFATRLRLDDMLPIAAALDDVGYGSLECWGGATFDACIRFLGEDPWLRLRELKKAMPKTPLQMLLRGQNLLGYRHYADDVVERFVERAVKNGMDVFRVFDAMNDPRNMKAALQAVRSHVLPDAAPLLGMFCFGNLMRESGVVERLSDTVQNGLINIVTIFLGLSVGAKLVADKFLQPQTLGILLLGVIAFGIGTAAGVLMAKLLNLCSKNKINPLIGSAGVSAVPMAARVSNKVGLESDPQNFLLMHAMGPNVAGVIGSAIAAGVMLKYVLAM